MRPAVGDPPIPMGSAGPAAGREVACVAHVHSTFSDGTATVPEIAWAASAAGADAVLLTDHDSLEARRQGFGGRHGDVHVVVGLEVSASSGHLLAFGIHEEVDHAGRTAAELWQLVRRDDGTGFAAHPLSAGSRISRRIGRPHPWGALDACPGMGVELWSLVTDAAEAWRGPRDIARFLRSPEFGAPEPPRRALEAWDRLCSIRRVPALGGLDAHQTGVRLGGRVLSPMPNERYFRLLQTHALCRVDGGGVDEPAILEALREGRSFLARPWIGSARGFRFWAESGDGLLDMGAEGPLSAQWTLHARSPAAARLRLLHGGVPVAEAVGRSLEHPVAEPGAYRIEARRAVRGAERLWILTNPIYMRSQEAAARRG